MSKGSTPVHHFDGFYDPDYTAEISTKMQVPDRIMVVEQSEPSIKSSFYTQPEKLVMNVPDRIFLGGRENISPLLESRTENRNVPQAVHLVNPPNVITLDSHHFPVIEEMPADRKHKSSDLIAQQNGYITHFDDYTKSYPLTPSTPPGMTSFSNGDDELNLLRRQVKTLTRRVLSIEQDNQQRQQREIVLYSLGIMYFFLKGLFWLHRHW